MDDIHVVMREDRKYLSLVDAGGTIGWDESDTNATRFTRERAQEIVVALKTICLGYEFKVKHIKEWFVVRDKNGRYVKGFNPQTATIAWTFKFEEPGRDRKEREKAHRFDQVSAKILQECLVRTAEVFGAEVDDGSDFDIRIEPA